MEYDSPEQVESARLQVDDKKPWKSRHHSRYRSFLKKCANKHERQRSKKDIEGTNELKKYRGYEL